MKQRKDVVLKPNECIFIEHQEGSYELTVSYVDYNEVETKDVPVDSPGYLVKIECKEK